MVTGNGRGSRDFREVNRKFIILPLMAYLRDIVKHAGYQRFQSWIRHTHASLLMFAGVSIASVARRLGHASMTTTQKTYLHIIQELENKDVDLVMRTLSGVIK